MPFTHWRRPFPTKTAMPFLQPRLHRWRRSTRQHQERQCQVSRPLWSMQCANKSVNDWKASMTWRYSQRSNALSRQAGSPQPCETISHRLNTRTTDSQAQWPLPCTVPRHRWLCHSDHRGCHQWPSQLVARRSGSRLLGSSTHTCDCPLLLKKKNKDEVWVTSALWSQSLFFHLFSGR